MNNPILKIKKIAGDTFSCCIKLSLLDSKKYIRPFDLIISIEGENEVLLRSKLKCDKIIMPEAYNNLLSDMAADFYTNIGTMKFRLHNYTNGDKIYAVCKYGEIEICNAEYVIDNNTINSFQYNYAGKIKIHSNSQKLLNQSRNIILDLVEKLPPILNIEWRQEIVYVIVDRIEFLYDYVKGIDILNGYCQTIQNNVICCVFDENNLEKILVHETVHAMLFSAFGTSIENIPRCQRLFIEGFCQHIMNIYSKRSSVYKRFLVAYELLNYQIDNLEDYLADENEKLNMYSDVIFSYDFLPYVYLYLEDIRRCFGIIFILPKQLIEVCSTIRSIISNIDMPDETEVKKTVETVRELYANIYNMLNDISFESHSDVLLDFRKKIESLYFGDY